MNFSSILTILLLFLFVKAPVWPLERNINQCLGIISAPVSSWTIPKECILPSLSNDKMNFIDPNNKCSFYKCASNSPSGASNQLGCQSNNTDENKVNYFMDYGYKYCNRFCTKTYNQLTNQGKLWLNKTLVCLQRALKLGCDNKYCNTCVDIKNYAFKSHAPCYVKHGLCELSHKDKIKIGVTPDLNDITQPEGLEQVGDVATLCARWMVNNPGQAIQNNIEAVRDILSGNF